MPPAANAGEQLTKLQTEVASDLCNFLVDRPLGASMDFREQVAERLDTIEVTPSSSRAHVFFQITGIVKSITNLAVPKYEQETKSHRKILRDESVVQADEKYKKYAVMSLSTMAEKYEPNVVEAPKAADKALHFAIAANASATTGELVSFLTQELSPKSQTPRWNGHNLSYACHVLTFDQHNQWTREIEAPVLVRNLAERLRGCNDRVEKGALFSLIGHSSQFRFFVRDLAQNSLDAALFNGLSRLVQRCPDQLDDQTVSMSLHQLSSFPTTYLSHAGRDAFTQFARTLADRLAAAPGPISHIALGSAFYGLTSFSSRSLSPEGKESCLATLNTLATLLESCSEPFTSATVASIGSGLKDLDPQDFGSQGLSTFTRIVKALDLAVQRMPDPPNTAAASAVVFGSWTRLASPDSGLRASTDSLVSTTLLRVSHSPSSISDLTALADCARVLFSSRERHTRAVENLFKAFANSTVSDRTHLSRNNGEPLTEQLIATAHSVLNQTFNLYGVAPNRGVASFLESIGPRVEKHFWQNRSNSEQNVGAWVARLLNCNPDHALCESGFEMDILVRTTEGFINIEVDGPHHDAPTQQLQDKQREGFLEKVGIRVVRIPWNASADMLYDKLGHLQAVDMDGYPIPRADGTLT